jgi:hypothetical protein
MADLVAEGTLNGIDHCMGNFKISNVQFARLTADEKVIVRIDDNRVPEFWVEIEIPVQIFDAWCLCESNCPPQSIVANGLVQLNGKRNANGIDGARIFSFHRESQTARIRVVDSRVEGFWMDVFVGLSKFREFVLIQELSK